MFSLKIKMIGDWRN